MLSDLFLRNILLQDASAIALGDRTKWRLADDCRRNGKCEEDFESDTCKICGEYKTILRKCSVIDYDDQIFLACKLLRSDKEISREWRSKTKYLLIDEYQDINHAQFELISLLTKGQTEGIFAVGDDDQSIYSFRGGSPRYIQDFDDLFPGDTKIGRLSKSWRCPEHILKGSRAVIQAFYPGSVDKPEPTFSEKIKHNNKIQFFNVPSDQREAEIIAKEVEDHISDNSVIIIIPNSNYYPPIRDELRKRGLPYRYKSNPSKNGIIRFTIIEDWVSNPDNNLFLRYFLDSIINNYNEITNQVTDDKVHIKKKRIIASDIISELWRNVDQTNSLFSVIKSIKVKELNFFDLLRASCLDPALSMLGTHGTQKAYLPDFLRHSGQTVAPGQSPKNIISEIREWKNEIFGSTRSAPLRPVEIYNLPSSKGLEGQIIITVGFSENIMPNPERDIEEQSRLAFVAMTRAKKKLLIFHARKRSGGVTFNQNSYQLKESRFIGTIPSEHIDSIYIKPIKKNISR